MAFTLSELARRLGGELIGDASLAIDGLAPLDSAGPTQLAFLANPKYLSQVMPSRAGAVLLSAADLERAAGPRGSTAPPGRNWLVVANPYASFARIEQWLVAQAEPPAQPGIHPSAVVDDSASVAATAIIGAHAVLEAGVVIGERVRIGAGAFIGRGSRIDHDSLIYPRVTIYHGCRLGARAIVHSGAVIGSDGFGFAPDFPAPAAAGEPGNTAAQRVDEGEWVKIPQIGGVEIGPDVEIGANTTIDRGALTDTVIEKCVKIDNLVQIAHNCRIGAYTVIAACTGIAGSTVIGRHCMLGGAVGIAGHVTLGDRVIVTAKSGVSKSLPKAGVYTSAFPAIDNADWNRNAALMRNLDKMRDRVRQLEAAVADLKTAP